MVYWEKETARRVFSFKQRDFVNRLPPCAATETQAQREKEGEKSQLSFFLVVGSIGQFSKSVARLLGSPLPLCHVGGPLTGCRLPQMILLNTMRSQDWLIHVWNRLLQTSRAHARTALCKTFAHHRVCSYAKTFLGGAAVRARGQSPFFCDKISRGWAAQLRFRARVRQRMASSTMMELSADFLVNCPNCSFWKI